jgi:hypothetical protein
LLGQDCDEHVGDARVVVAQTVELAAVDRMGLAGLERLHRGCPDRLASGDERKLPECLPGPAEGENRLVAERCAHARREAALRYEMEGVGRVALVEDDLAARKRPAARDLQQPAHVLRRHAPEQLPLHVAKCRAFDTQCVAAANDTETAGA